MILNRILRECLNKRHDLYPCTEWLKGWGVRHVIMRLSSTYMNMHLDFYWLYSLEYCSLSLAIIWAKWLLILLLVKKHYEVKSEFPQTLQLFSFFIKLGRCDVHNFNLQVVTSGWRAVLRGTAESLTFCMAHCSDPNLTYQYPNNKEEGCRVRGNSDYMKLIVLIVALYIHVHIVHVFIDHK